MSKTYILCPDFSTSPPPLGPLQLGHIIHDPFDPELVPLNRTCRIAISPDHIFPPDIKEGFTSTRAALKGGGFCVWAHFLALFGLQAGAGIDIGSDNTLRVKCLETQSFEPDLEYVRRSMDADPVRAFMKAVKYNLSVFMITGLKIARGACLVRSDTRKFGSTLGASVPVYGIETGVGGAVCKEQINYTCFEHSTDFILAFRVRKIRIKRGKLEQEFYTKGAMMMEGNLGADDGKPEILGLDDDVALDEFGPASLHNLNVVEDMDDGIKWIEQKEA